MGREGGEAVGNNFDVWLQYTQESSISEMVLENEREGSAGNGEMQHRLVGKRWGAG